MIRATPASPRALIQARALGAIEVALLSHERDVHVGAGAKRLAAQATTEYHDRFLIELIQNGHDAHRPDERTGEIAVRFRHDEGAFGVVYVANRGRPFSRSNFKTICELGLSDKLPGEAIGNKGIGFKSVLQICARPEIYSAHPDSVVGPAPPFEGFCFSFATDEQLLDLLAGDEEQLAIVRSETAPFHLPVALDQQPETVAAFAMEGFASVIRLPLDRPGAPADVQRQLDALRDADAPLLLFLERLQRLRLEETGCDEPPKDVDLRRHATALNWRELGTLHGELVHLGAQGEFLCVSLAVPEKEVASVITAAVTNQELEETWLEWREDAVITAAVGIDGRESEPGRIYTYLPMEVEAPFAGHLNAPFYARLDRRDLNRDLSLNALLLDAGARACRLAARAIATRDERTFAAAAADFFSWSSSEATRLQRALGSDEPAVSDAVLAVVREAGEGWGSLDESYVWYDEGRRTLTTRAFAENTDVAFFDARMGPLRIERIRALHRDLLQRDMLPESTELAEWVERIAEARATRRGGPISWWNAYYDELAELFEHDGDDLEGRKILLDEDGEIRAAAASDAAAQSKAPTVFFQPVRERAEGIVDIDAADDVRIPKTLRRRLVFVNPELQWLERVGTTRKKKKSRLFLEEFDLVKQYAARSLLENVRELLRTSRSKDVYRDALRLAFRLQRTRDYDQRPALRDVGLRVPCRGGWVAATEAHFSAAWPGTLGESLERLGDLCGGSSRDLAAVEHALLLPPDEWPFSVEAADWLEFLRRAGVRDGIWPLPSRTRAEQRGWGFSPDQVARQIGLPEALRPTWIEAVEADGGSPQFAGGLYRNRTPFYRLPGQAEYDDLPAHARVEYANLVAASSGSWLEEHFAARIQRSDVSSRNLDPFTWPTPVTAFVARQMWVPMTSPQARDEVSFVRLAQAWHYSERLEDSDSYVRPDFAPLIPIRLRRDLDANAASLVRLRKNGLSVWNDPIDAARLVRHLGELVRSGAVADHFAPNLRRAYEQAWGNSIATEQSESAAASGYLVITRSGQLDSYAIADSEEQLYVNDGGSHLTESLLQLSSRPLLDVGAGFGEAVAEALEARLGERLLRTSRERVLVLSDGDPVSPDEARPLLLSGNLEWVDGLVMASLELRRGAFRRFTGPVRDRALRTLRTLRICLAEDIALQIGVEKLPPPRGMREAVPLPDPSYPTLVIRAGSVSLTWSQLQAALAALADLIGFAELAPTMQLAAARLAPDDANLPVEPPSTLELAEAIDETEQRVRDVIRSLRGSAAAALDLLAPVIVAHAGLEEYERMLAGLSEDDDEDSVFAQVSELGTSLSAADVKAHAHGAGGADDLRRLFAIDLTPFNEALVALGRPPIRYREEQAHAFAAYVAEHRDEVLLELRRSYLPLYRALQPLDAYAEARESLAALEPDPNWLDVYEIPPLELMEHHVRLWLAGVLADGQASADHLQPVDVVRRDNRGRLRDVLEKAQQTVLAWSEARSADVPPIWEQADLELTIWDELLAAGRTDFEPLETPALLDWLSNQGHWPNEMSLTLNLVDLGLTDDDLAHARTEEERERAHRDFLKRSIEIGGARHSAAIENFATLAEVARDSITETLLKTRGSFASLGELGKPASPKERTRGTTNAVTRNLTESQRGAIGLVGEVVALEWLKRRYNGANDDSWRSGYRNYVLGGSNGIDSLGYDFLVPSGRSSYLFEVKATTGDDMQIELGESEVLAARQNARNERYRILYIPFALDPARRSIHVLPNPFSERGRDLYQLAGSGLRYRFRLDGGT